ncbi:MAG TPA: hypothetical protein VF658_13895 [Pyrinomonadaceae bacterium]|jgi:uncharacterized protein (TIGR02646 family)
MIRVDKSKVLAPDALASEKGVGKLETKKAEDFYRKLREKQAQAKSAAVDAVATAAAKTTAGKKPAVGRKQTREKAFKFSAYGELSVRRALEQLFNHKCAYCESRYAATQPVDVEHWRPKAKVDPDDGEGEIEFNYGYYWLAASWDNLLPSCIDCNRKRTHKIESDGTERTVGKGNRFPLAPGSQRANAPGSEQSEQPLLLNPYIDDPEKHLEFLDIGVVRPKLEEDSKQPSAKGKVSVEAYALNRLALVQERREVLLLLQQRMYTIVSLMKVLDQLAAEPPAESSAEAQQVREQRREIIEDLLSHELEALSRFREPDRPFSLMARQVIDKFIKSLT